MSGAARAGGCNCCSSTRARRARPELRQNIVPSGGGPAEREGDRRAARLPPRVPPPPAPAPLSSRVRPPPGGMRSHLRGAPGEGRCAVRALIGERRCHSGQDGQGLALGLWPRLPRGADPSPGGCVGPSSRAVFPVPGPAAEPWKG